jgi:hypothetical protein
VSGADGTIVEEAVDLCYAAGLVSLCHLVEGGCDSRSVECYNGESMIGTVCD